jgi:hypothetical protein
VEPKDETRPGSDALPGAVRELTGAVLAFAGGAATLAATFAFDWRAGTALAGSSALALGVRLMLGESEE